MVSSLWQPFAVLGGPLVWSLHDTWAFTGGCHYTDGCERFIINCGRCPALGSVDENDLSRSVWSRKQAAWSGIDLTVIASSQWMAKMARTSAIFRGKRIEIIPNCVDPIQFDGKDKAKARAIFGLPQDRRLILFGALSSAGDRRKGYHLLAPALNFLARRLARNSVDVVVMGMDRPKARLGSLSTHTILGSLKTTLVWRQPMPPSMCSWHLLLKTTCRIWLWRQ